MVEFFNLRVEIEVLWNLLNSLTAHRGLNYIFSAHIHTSHSCVAKRGINNISWNLRSGGENFPDLKTAFKLNYLNHLHRVLAVLLRILRQNGCDLRTSKIFDAAAM